MEAVIEPLVSRTRRPSSPTEQRTLVEERLEDREVAEAEAVALDALARVRLDGRASRARAPARPGPRALAAALLARS